MFQRGYGGSSKTPLWLSSRLGKDRLSDCQGRQNPRVYDAAVMSGLMSAHACFFLEHDQAAPGCISRSFMAEPL